MTLTWMTTKAAPFGSLIAGRKTRELNDLFFRTLRQSLLILVACAASLLLGVIASSVWMPRISQRVMGWPVFLFLLLTAIGSHVIQSEAIYLRAHKCEPFLLQSVIVALSIAVSVSALTKMTGALGASLAYFAVLGVFGVAFATRTFLRKRAEWAEAEYST
jgi:uncharacterized membrane protein YadS